METEKDTADITIAYCQYCCGRLWAVEAIGTDLVVGSVAVLEEDSAEVLEEAAEVLEEAAPVAAGNRFEK